MHTPDQLLLPARRGRLPADIAYLVAKYPRETWPRHDNFEGMARGWVDRHNMFRELGGMLKTATAQFREGELSPEAFQRFFAPRLDMFLGHLEGHHHIEDSAYFPLFRAKDKRLIVGFDLLENDHEVIHAQLLASAESANALMAALHEEGDTRRFAADGYADSADRLLGWLLRHLEDEEDLIVPTILEHTEDFLHRY